MEEGEFIDLLLQIALTWWLRRWGGCPEKWDRWWGTGHHSVWDRLIRRLSESSISQVDHTWVGMLKAEVLITFSFPPHFPRLKQSIRRPVVEPKFVMQSHNHCGLLCLQLIPIDDTIQSSKQSLFMPKENGSSKRTWFQKSASSTIFNLETKYNIVTHFSQKQWNIQSSMHFPSIQIPNDRNLWLSR